MTEKDNQREKEEIDRMAKTYLESDLVKLVSGGVVAKKFYTNGREMYSTVMNGGLVEKRKKEIYAGRQKEDDDFPEEIPYTTNYEIRRDIKTTKEQMFALSTLGNLEEIVRGFADGFEGKLPEKLKNYSRKSLGEEARKAGAVDEKGKIDIEKLPEDLKYAFMAFENLRETYKTACAEKIAKQFRYASQNQVAKEISEKYSPTPREKSSENAEGE